MPTTGAVVETRPCTAERRLAPRCWWAWAALEALLAFGLAMFHIGERSLWYDEAVSAVASGSSVTELERVARTFDPNMSGYHAVLFVWQRVFGSSETGLRSLSAVALAAAVVMMVLLGRRLHDERTGLVAGLVLAVAPFAVRYGQEARSYALEVLVITGATYLFVRIVDEGVAVRRAWPAWAYGATAAFACYVHLYSVFVLMAHAGSLVLLDRACIPWRRLRQSVVVCAVLLVPMGFWLASGPSERIQWIPTPTLGDVITAVRHVSGGGVVAATLVALAFVAGVRWRRSLTRVRRSRAVWADGLGLLWLVLPLVASVSVSWTLKPIFLDRYLIVCVPALALVAATVVARLRARAVAAGVMTVVTLGSLVAVGGSYGGDRTDWRDAISYLAAYVVPTDGVVVCPARARLPVAYYVDRTITPVIRPIPLSPAYGWDAGFRVDGVDPLTPVEWMDGGPDRIWVLGRVERCGFTFPGRDHTVSVKFTRTTLERYDRH